MARFDKLALYASGVLASFLLLYCVPNLVESYCLVHFGPLTACVFVGNLLGCAVLSASSWRRALGLYLLLASLDFLLLHFDVVSPHFMVWITDLVPALLVTRSAVSLAGVLTIRAEE